MDILGDDLPWRKILAYMLEIRTRSQPLGVFRNFISKRWPLGGNPGSKFSFSWWRPEGNGNPLQCSCLENPRVGGAWWAAVYGVAQSRTRLKRLSSSSSKICLVKWLTLLTLFILYSMVLSFTQQVFPRCRRECGSSLVIAFRNSPLEVKAHSPIDKRFLGI